MSRWKMRRNITVSDSSKFQAPKNHQAPRAKTALRAVGLASPFRFGVRDLELLWSLAFGAWSFAQRRLKKPGLRPLIRLDAIEHFARATGRSRHAELRGRDDRLERGRTVGCPGGAQIRRGEQLKGHARAKVGHVEIDLDLVPRDRRCAAELQIGNRRHDGGGTFDWP